MVYFVCGVLFIISRASSAAASHAASAATTRSESARPRFVIVGRGARVAGRQRLLLAAQLLWRHCCIGTAAAQCTGGCCNGFGQRWNVHGRSRQLSRATVTAVIKRCYGHAQRCFYAAGCVRRFVHGNQHRCRRRLTAFTSRGRARRRLLSRASFFALCSLLFADVRGGADAVSRLSAPAGGRLDAMLFFTMLKW